MTDESGCEHCGSLIQVLPASACWASIALCLILNVGLSAERCLIGFPVTSASVVALQESSTI